LTLDKIKFIESNRVACPAPFTTIAIRASQASNAVRYSCCCNLDVPVIENPDEYFDRLRSAIKQGKWSQACSTCYIDEANGAQSERMRYILNMADQAFDHFVKNYQVIEQEIFIKFSNLCTLACRSCNSVDSSTYARIIKDTSVAPAITHDFSDDPDNWALMVKLIVDASKIHEFPVLHLIGGETLVQAGSTKLLRWMYENNLTSYFSLRITTSLAINLSDELITILKSFKQVSFNLSIDSVGDNYNYIRWPAKWSKIDQNLADLVANTEDMNYMSVLTPVFSINNIFYLPDYVDYFHRWIKDTGRFVQILNIHLHRPDFLTVESLPEPYRSAAADVVEKTLEHPMFVSNKQLTFKRYLQTTLAQLRTGAGNEERFNHFLKFTADFDKRTDTKFSELNNRLWNQLDKHHIQVYNKQYQSADINQPIYISIIPDAQSKIQLRFTQPRIS